MGEGRKVDQTHHRQFPNEFVQEKKEEEGRKEEKSVPSEIRFHPSSL
jgi:hypothetical protein